MLVQFYEEKSQNEMAHLKYVENGTPYLKYGVKNGIAQSRWEMNDFLSFLKVSIYIQLK